MQEPFNEPPMTLDVTIAQEVSRQRQEIPLSNHSLQSAASVHSSSLTAYQIPHDYTGGWYRISNRLGRLSSSFNLTIPSVTGNISNLIALDATVGFVGDAGNYAQIAYFEDNPMSKAVSGCPSKSTCRATVRAPALAVESCRTDSVAVDYWKPLENKKNVVVYTSVAPPCRSLILPCPFVHTMSRQDHPETLATCADDDSQWTLSTF